MKSINLTAEECRKSPKKQNLYIHDLSSFDSELFCSNLLQIHWPHVINIHNKDPNEAFERLNETIDKIVNKHLQKRKMTKKEIKQKQNHGSQKKSKN